ncbi:xanthine dehydrogenase small subunit [Endozoicomonas lisbonensis]|uniref:Xanthine dehydrogenase small subunit n=1 Tax=Endozoicomonas lisbonensis TaxID=3120522 RepID=A0ABV2SLS2_9GAMM
MINFLLNDKLVEVNETASDTTVLDYLRGNATGSQQRRTGTKEGCCSGDCGACTVVVGEPEGDEIRYRTMNACIALMPSLHGKQLLTVEDLAEGDQLHPVQQALVDHHASQCGFCTPGIVMSLFALHHENPESKPDVLEALGGNLCRCTGYRPLVDAAQELAEKSPSDVYHQNRTKIIDQLNAMKGEEGFSANGSFIPDNEDELADYLETNPDARLLAGGTDLGLEITQQLKRLKKLVVVGQVNNLQNIEKHENELVIGAAATYRKLEPVLEGYFPEFAQMLKRLGSQQVRNQGTLGGNIGNASPIGDTPPVLLALDASIDCRKGKRVRNLPLDKFFLDYKKTDLQEGEYISRIRIPLKPHDLKVYKLSKRYGDDISTVLAAINLVTDDNGVVTKARVAFGGMAAIPRRALRCEQILLGQPLDDETLARTQAALQEEFQPMSDVRASSEYRIQSACNLLERYFRESAGQNMRIIYHA